MTTTATGINGFNGQMNGIATYAIPVIVEDGGEYQLRPNITHCLALTGRKHDYDCRKTRQRIDGLCTLHSKKNRAAGGSFTFSKV